ncbi:MAG TPA: hypothetical protein VF762_13210 [Blastocatellia bacterium]|jgi:hypothetical protein
MIKALIAAIALLSLAACGGAQRPTGAGATSLPAAQSFSIISEQADPVAGSTNVIIKFPKATLPGQVKAAAESLVASRRADYRRVTVKSFLEGSDLNGVPFAVSRVENDAVDTVFNATPGGSVRIPTH